MTAINPVVETRLLLEKLAPLNQPKIMVQIGASEGNYAKKYAKAGWMVYAFDAAPIYSPEAFSAQMEGNPNYNFYSKAIALNDEPRVTFYYSKVHPSISSLAQYRPELEPVEVPAISLRRFYAEKSISAIDYFMIDAETMDLAIMRTHDWSIPINALMMEVTPKNVMEIHDYIMGQRPDYWHFVFDWRKPVAKAGVVGSCERTCSAQEFSEVPRDGTAFGDILYWIPSHTEG